MTAGRLARAGRRLPCSGKGGIQSAPWSHKSKYVFLTRRRQGLQDDFLVPAKTAAARTGVRWPRLQARVESERVASGIVHSSYIQDAGEHQPTLPRPITREGTREDGSLLRSGQQARNLVRRGMPGGGSRPRSAGPKRSAHRAARRGPLRRFRRGDDSGAT
jgi:hypothetical protein